MCSHGMCFFPALLHLAMLTTRIFLNENPLTSCEKTYLNHHLEHLQLRSISQLQGSYCNGKVSETSVLAKHRRRKVLHEGVNFIGFLPRDSMTAVRATLTRLQRFRKILIPKKQTFATSKIIQNPLSL